MSDLRQMRGIATGALIAMAMLFVLAMSLQHHSSLWSYVAAFAEAAMVGALADWFAVVALFRHPLGIPIPHTAIIPTNKDRIGRTLATFVVGNFLTGEAICSRLERTDLTATAAEWLQANAKEIADRVVAGAPILLRGLKDEDIQRFLHDTILLKLRTIALAPLAGRLLKVLTAGGKLDDVLAAAIGLGEELVHANQELIRAQVRKRIPLPDFPGISFVKDKLTEAIAVMVLAAILESLRDMRRQPNHPVRREFRARMTKLAEALQDSEAYRQQGEKIKEEVLRHPAITGYLAELTRDLQRDLEQDLASGDSHVRARVKQAVGGLAHLLIEDRPLRGKLNGWLRAALIVLVDTHGAEAGRFIQERVGRWDSGQVTRKLEEAVGRDLQYIRLNGTLVGGAVGLVIHTVSKWVW